MTDLNGVVYTNFSFEIEQEGNYVHGSCGVQFEGHFYIYGGIEAFGYKGDSRQIAKVSGCALKRIGTLPFTFQRGACAATSSKLFFCFDELGDGKSCQLSTDPTGSFIGGPRSIEQHKKIRIAASEGNPNLVDENHDIF